MTSLWEILVPTVKPELWINGSNRYFRLKYHKLWDAKVLEIAKGLTILQPNHGQWVSPQGEFFNERMIPVRIACSRAQIEEIANMTAKHYGQKAIFMYKVSDEVLIIHY